MTYRTRFCQRTFPDIPFADKECGCVDCRLIRGLRRIVPQRWRSGLQRFITFIFGGPGFHSKVKAWSDPSSSSSALAQVLQLPRINVRVERPSGVCFFDEYVKLSDVSALLASAPVPPTPQPETRRDDGKPVDGRPAGSEPADSHINAAPAHGRQEK